MFHSVCSSIFCASIPCCSCWISWGVSFRKLSTPGIAARVRPLSHRIWICPLWIAYHKGHYLLYIMTSVIHMVNSPSGSRRHRIGIHHKFQLYTGTLRIVELDISHFTGCKCITHPVPPYQIHRWDGAAYVRPQPGSPATPHRRYSPKRYCHTASS